MASSGLQLGVHVGPVPMPAPAELVHAVTRVKVDEGSGDAQSGFEPNRLWMAAGLLAVAACR